jgi:hypothetical protein
MGSDDPATLSAFPTFTLCSPCSSGLGECHIQGSRKRGADNNRCQKKKKNSTFTSPAVPVLLQILSGTQQASDLLPNGTVYGLEGNKSVEISIPAGAIGGPVS